MPKEKFTDINILDEDGVERNIRVIKPTNKLNSEAQRIGAKVWTDCIQDGVMTKQELKQLMKDKGIWGEAHDKRQREIEDSLVSLERQLYINKRKKMKLSEAKQIAYDMKRKRIELRDHIAERIALEGNTAESLADNAKIDFLVANCTLFQNGQKVYKTIEDYQNGADDIVAFTAAAALAEMLYSLDASFERGLPENKFLVAAGLVNEDLDLVNKEGELVDLDGKVINERGWYQDEDGNRVDKNGNPMTDQGTYIPQVSYIDDETGEEIVVSLEDEQEGEDTPEEETTEENNDTES